MNTQERLKQLESRDMHINELKEIIKTLNMRVLKLEDIHEDEGYRTYRPRNQHNARRIGK